MSPDFSARIDALSEISQTKLVKILDSVPGKKNIVIEYSLMKPLDQFIGTTVLRNHGIDKIFKLDKTGPQFSSGVLIYFIRYDLITAKLVCNQINSIISGNQEYENVFHIIIVPKLLKSIELLFEEEGLFGKVVFHDFTWELIQLDQRILSFESPKIFKQLFIENDQNSLVPIAKSLWSFQCVFGKIPFVMCLGKYSNIIMSMVDCFMEELGEPEQLDSDFGCLLILDRDVDYASPLLIPGTYTSLVSDVMNVSTNVVEIKKPDLEKKELASSMQLTSDDEIYNQIKNKHFSDVFLYLKYKTNELNAETGRRNNMSLKEMADFVENDLNKAVNLRKTLSNHILVCERVTSQIGQKFESLCNCQKNILDCESRRETIMDIEDIISTATDMNLALRLICLLSLSQNGLTQEEANNLKGQFFHAYGYEHIVTFHNLEKTGLIQTVQSFMETTANLASKVVQVVSLPKKSQFQTVSQKLKLFPDTSKEYNLSDPQNPGYVFGGAYIPLVAQLVNYIIKKEFTLADLTRFLLGNNPNKSDVKCIGKPMDAVPNINPRNIFVYVVGGITYAEIAALQFIETRTGCKIVCGGSSIITGKQLVESAV